MLINHDITVDFLNSKIGPYVELNPLTDKPRFIKGLNSVWLAVEEFGGFAYTALYFDIDVMHVHQWIDDHYIPVIFAYEISKKLGYSDLKDIQEPSTGYHDEVTGFCWPLTWKLGWDEIM